MQVIEQAANLGDAKVPAAVANEDRARVEQAFKEGFISSYVKVMRVCAALAGLGALMAFFIYKK